MRIVLVIVWAVLLGMAGLLLYLHGWVQVGIPPHAVRVFFRHRPFQPHHHTYRFEGRKIHYVEIGTAGRPQVLLLHGSPGSWTDYLPLMSDTNLLSRVHLLVVDRPGFGPMKERGPEPQLARQAKAISPLLDRSPAGSRAIVVGHSYGGAVAARLAMDFPDQVAGLILLAPPLDPALEKPAWYQIPGDWNWIAWALPHVLVNSNREILGLAEELEKMLSHWDKVRVPITLLQGSEDPVVDPKHAAFIQGLLTHSKVDVRLLPGQQHDLPAATPELVSEVILEHIE